MQVKRYLYTGESVETHEEGEYVLHSDYAKLETELQDYKRALEMCCREYGNEEVLFWTEKARKERLERGGK